MSRRVRWSVLVVALMAAPVDSPGASAAGPTLPLPDADRSEIEQRLGKGVVGPPVAAPSVSDPARYLALKEGARSYRVVSGPNTGTSEKYQLNLLKRPGGPVRWRYDAAGAQVSFLSAQSDGSFVLTAAQEIKDGVITRYAPAEPFLPGGLAPGDERKVTMAVKVYDLGHPDDLEHQGSIDVTCRYVGAYRVTVPAGTFDAILIKWVFTGKVGPASLDDTQYRFFAPDVGMVATIEKRDVSAFLIYNVHTKVGKVLTSKPR